VRRMAERSGQVVLVADSSKYGKVGFVRVLPVEGVHRLITDTGLEDRAEQELAGVGVQVFRA
jgi:DeoR/GlpR family transcriptional regulator of sugar metabolism